MMESRTATESPIRGTTVIVVRREGAVAMAGDGQVSMGNTILKSRARKVRKIHDGRILAGFAGATADAFTLLERFQEKLEAYRGNLARAAIELAKDWRMDRALRRLDALLLVADQEHAFILSGTGDVIEPDDACVAIGSGGPFATAAAQALLAHTSLSAEEIAREALRIAGEICIYTNVEISVETLDG